MIVLKILMNLLGLAGICFILFSVYLWIRALAEEDTGNWEKVVYCEECYKNEYCTGKPHGVEYCSMGRKSAKCQYVAENAVNERGKVNE